ncbi:NYN domain-containing protein [Dethiosulfatarculus sandiegensis]|uniref:Helicase n=1 Tax=Dethiosulfatarculus sandiegensis TaxID=1429043 RepID=A0A0D2HXZ0_9BACT|nr:NYN domain-containing protein [Dethiosulfatarculus sandiegensis]KIX15173.1 helicase [Dethiosulfatarculus sandiegensis]
MQKVAFLIDGWFMRKRVYWLKSFFYDGPGIRDYCMQHLRNNDGDFIAKDARLYRIFYYCTAPLEMKGLHPITDHPVDFGQTAVAQQQRKLFESIKRTPNIALRIGKTVWRNKNWIISQDQVRLLLKKRISVDDLSESDVAPQIEQKAVDMKLGLDIATLAQKKLVDSLILITADSDLVPAIKLAKNEGLQIGLDPLWADISDDLAEHVDFITTQLPEPAY